MDKLNNYQELIHDFFLAYEQFLITPPKPELDITVALDDERSQYIVLGFQPPQMRPYTEFAVA